MSDGLVDVDGAVTLGKTVAGVKVGTAPGNDLSHLKMKIENLVYFIPGKYFVKFYGTV